MSCNTRFNTPSKFKTTLEAIDKDMASVMYSIVESPTDEFLDSFSGGVDYRTLTKDSVIEGNLADRLDDNFEPRLFHRNGSHYLIMNNGDEFPIYSKESKIAEIFRGNIKSLNRLVEVLAVHFIKSNDVNFNFENIKIEDAEFTKSVKDVVSQKLEDMGNSLMMSDEMDHMIAAGSVMTVHEEALDEMVELVRGYFKPRGFSIVESENIDEETEESDLDENSTREDIGQSVGSVVKKGHSELNQKESVSNNVKMRLSFLTDTSKIDSLFNEDVPVDFNFVYNLLGGRLADNTTLPGEDLFQIYVDEIKKLATNPAFGFLNELLKSLEVADLSQDIKTEFVQAFNLDKSMFFTTEISSRNITNVEGVNTKEYTYTVMNVASVGNKEKAISRQWLKEFSEKLISDREGVIRGMNTLAELYKQEQLSEEQLNELQLTINSLGFNISENGFNYYLDNLSFDQGDASQHSDNAKILSAALNRLLTSALHKDGITYSDIVKTFEVGQLSKAESMFTEDGSDTSVNTGKKSKWIYSLPSYLSRRIKLWKKGEEGARELFKYFISSPHTKSSLKMRYLLGLDAKSVISSEGYRQAESIAELTTQFELNINESVKRLRGLTIGSFNTVQDKLSSKTGKELTKSEKIIDTVNKLLFNKLNSEVKRSSNRTTTAPGKSTEYEITDGFFVNATDGFEKGKYLVRPETLELFKGYFKAEIQRMITAKTTVDEVLQGLIEGEEDFSKLVTYYHTGGQVNKSDRSLTADDLVKVEGNKTTYLGNAFKSQLLPDLFDIVQEELDKTFRNSDIEYSNVLESEDHLSVYDTIIEKHLSDLFNTKITETVAMMYDLDIIRKIGTDLYENVLLDKDIISVYPDLAQQIPQIAGDIFVNGLINHIEYSKMFAGDMAYYKNPVDYIKRAGAMYTDGRYTYSDVTEFTIAVGKSVNIESPYHNDIIEKMELLGNEEGLEIMNDQRIHNSADAQSWITPKRWMDLNKGIKWSQTHQSFFDKVMGDNIEPFTPEELKIGMQPIKGVFFDIVDGVPTFLKYSQAILTPRLIKDSRLNTMYQSMVDNKIDEFLTFDAIKVGSPIPTQIHNAEGFIIDELGKLYTKTLPQSGWKLQQDLHPKGMHQVELGTQIQKNVISGLVNSLESQFNFRGESVSGEDVLSMIDNTIGDLSDKGLQEVLDTFDVDENGKIKNLDLFYNSIIDELEKKGSDKATIQALKNHTTIYGLPGYKTKLDNVFASMVNRRIVKIQTNGGSFIQMSNFGFNKEKAIGKGVIWNPKFKEGNTVSPPNYVFETDENGDILLDEKGKKVIKLGVNGLPLISPGEVLISGSFIAKYIPNYHTYSAKALFEGENGNPPLIDPKILETVVGYRIPNQALASNDALKIVGILPAEQGDTIVAYTEITTKTGSDFDIDKMYIMFPSMRPQYNKDGDVTNLTYINLKKDEQGNTLPLSQQSKEAVQNQLIELYQSVLTHPDNYNQLIKSIDYPYMKDDIMSIVGKESEGDFDNFDAIKDIEKSYSFKAGEAGVGQEANALSDYNLGSLANIRIDGFKMPRERVNTDNGGDTQLDRELSSELSAKDIRDYAKLRGISVEEASRYKTLPISNTISAILNAFVDIAKDPYITKGNWTMLTTNTGNLLLRSGVHPFYVNAFLAQPIIKEYSEFVQKYEASKETQFEDTKRAFLKHKVNQSIKEFDMSIGGTTIPAAVIYNNGRILDDAKILKHYKELTGNKEYSFTAEDNVQIDRYTKSIENRHREYFVEGDSFKNVFSKDLIAFRDNITTQKTDFNREVLLTFFNIQSNSKKLKLSVDSSKHAVNGMGKNTTSLLIALNTIEIAGNPNNGLLGYRTKMYTEKNVPRFITRYAENLKKILEITEANPNLFLSAHKTIQNSYNFISQEINDKILSDEKLGTALEKFFYSYTMSGIPGLQLSASKLKELLSPEFIEKFQTIKDNNVGRFKILDELDVVEGENRNYIKMITQQKASTFQDEMVDSFEDLMVNHPEFTNDLVAYSYITSGFEMTPNQFYSFISPSWFIKNNINGYIKSRRQEYNTVAIDNNFIDGFFLANLENTAYVKAFRQFKNDYGTVVNKERNVFGIISSDPDGKLYNYSKFEPSLGELSIDPDAQTSTVYYKNIGKDVQGNLIYSSYIKNTEGDYVKVQPTIMKDEKGNKIVMHNIGAPIFKAAKLTQEHKDYIDTLYERIDYGISESTVDKSTSEDFEKEQSVVLKLQPENKRKILDGSKTTTIRKTNQTTLSVGEKGIINVDGRDFNITLRGNLSIAEAGGKESMILSEGLTDEVELIFKQSKDWVNGKGKMFVYDISPSDGLSQEEYNNASEEEKASIKWQNENC